MQQYANAYSIAIENSGEMTVVNFSQKGPVFSDEGVVGTETTPIASIVMNTGMAKALSEALREIIEKAEEDLPDSQ